MTLDPQGRMTSAIAIEIAAGEIRAVSSVVNPKLRHLGPVADPRR